MNIPEDTNKFGDNLPLAQDQESKKDLARILAVLKTIVNELPQQDSLEQFIKIFNQRFRSQMSVVFLSIAERQERSGKHAEAAENYRQLGKHGKAKALFQEAAKEAIKNKQATQAMNYLLKGGAYRKAFNLICSLLQAKITRRPE